MPIDADLAPASHQTASDLQAVRIATWAEDGAMESSVTALDCMFTWMNATVFYTNASHVFDGGLNETDVLVFPGGSESSYTATLGLPGMELVRSFVSNGGSYFGICGGCTFGTRWYLGLFNGSYTGPVAGVGPYIMSMDVNHESTGPDLSEESENYSMLYWNSHYFRGDGIIPIVTYPSNDEAAMIVHHYGHGTVFLSSPHPEYEENNDRDGTAEFDDHDDPDSEWGLLMKVTRWLVDTSPDSIDTTTSEPTTTNGTSVTPLDPMLLIGILGVSGVVIIITVVVKRR